jgi:SPASM domain peptide maturase of grasp-with-spasm system
MDFPYLKLYACCIPVRGASRSMVCDVQRSTFEFIPNSLCDLLINYPKLSYQFVEQEFGAEALPIVKEYFKFLEEKELAFWATEDELDRFPNMSLEWASPLTITNAVIDIKETDYDVQNVLQTLSSFGCFAVELRYYRYATRDELIELVKSTDGSRIINIQLVIPYQESDSKDDFLELFPRVFRVTYYNSPKTEASEAIFGANIVYRTDDLVADMHCGKIAASFFSTCISTFTESQHHNTCLNRKISIDKDGFIKNCPSMAHHYGHISDTKLEDVVKLPEFQKYWNIKKDEIAKCKDCEFRHICTDCRAYIDNPEDIYSAPLKCGYDPYTNIWEDWSTNPLKEKAKMAYGF